MTERTVCPICEGPLEPWDRDPDVLVCDFHAWGACPQCGREGVCVQRVRDGRLLCLPCVAVDGEPGPWIALVAEEVVDLERIRAENEAYRRSVGGRLP